MNELEDSFNVSLRTDMSTMKELAASNILCRVKRSDCGFCEDHIYLNAKLFDTSIVCYYGSLNLAEHAPLEVALLFDEVEVTLSGDNVLKFSNVMVMDILPKPHFFKGTVDHIELLLSIDMSESQLNCILAS